jgi:hypothetical protein
MENNFTDRHGNALFQIMPQTPNDTLMACFSLCFYSSESLTNRKRMRQLLLKRFKQIVFVGNSPVCGFNSSPRTCEELNPHSHLHPAIRAFIHRLHTQHPDSIPTKSAEKLLISASSLFAQECRSFLQKNEQVGFITDRHVFCYLIADVFRVKVNIDDISLSIDDKDYYEIYLRYHDHKFILLQPCVKLKRLNYQSTMKLEEGESRKSKIINGLYELKGIGYLAPPKIKGYKVHSYMFYVNACILHVLVSKREYIYVFDGEIWIGYGKGKIYFYLTEGQHCICAIKANNYEEAFQAISFEM